MSLLERVDSTLLDGALNIVRKLNHHGHQAYFAGGVVRDLLLERLVSDIDIATSAPPEKIEELFPKTLLVGKRFGVVVVVMGSTSYEVTTFRREGAYLDGRHPSQVTFSDARQDALRRDFTVNALFLDAASGEVLDYVAGREDLERRLIRTVGLPRQRFEEDRLRVLRAVRFAAQLGFEIEGETWEAVRSCAGGLTEVSWERIRDELFRILTGADPARGLQLLLDSGILAVILPEVAAMRGVPQPPEFHPEGDVFEHTRLMFQFSEARHETLALGILLHDVGKPPTFTVKERIRFDGHVEVGARMAEEICRRLRCSRDQMEEVVDLVRHHLRFMNVQEMRESTLKRFLRKENFATHLELHRLDCLASHGDLSSYHFCLQRLQELEEEAIRPKLLLNGHDLIALGLKPGPLFSEILSTLEDLQLEGQLMTRDQALDWVKRKYLAAGN